jgi:hypothetical protein
VADPGDELAARRLGGPLRLTRLVQPHDVAGDAPAEHHRSGHRDGGHHRAHDHCTRQLRRVHEPADADHARERREHRDQREHDHRGRDRTVPHPVQQQGPEQRDRHRAGHRHRDGGEELGDHGPAGPAGSSTPS